MVWDDHEQARFAQRILYAIPLGLYGALKGPSIGGRLVSALSQLGISVPEFWAGLLLEGAVPDRYVRASLLALIDEEFITVARSTGLTTRGALARHGLRNSAVTLSR